MRFPIVLALALAWAASISAYPRLKFQHWFPQYEQHFLVAATQCQQELDRYWINDQTQCHSTCACAADCILENVTTTRGTIASNFASAQVLLGLMPSSFIFVGPTVDEMAALSTYRPLLAGLLTLGSPAISVQPLFRPINVHQVFKSPYSSPCTRLWTGFFQRQTATVGALIRGLSYLAAIAAVANNVQNSMRLDLRTVSGWRCNTMFMPLIWSCFPVVVHGWGFVAVRAQVLKGYRPSWRSGPRSNTFRLAAAGTDSQLSEALFSMASLASLAHLLFGTLVLSSLIFISTLEAAQVFGAYIASSIVCRIISTLELAKMRSELRKEGELTVTLPDSSEASNEERRAYTM